jgi:hypothetical protein
MPDYLERLGLTKPAVVARIRFLIDRANVHSRDAHNLESGEDWRRIAYFGAAGTCQCEAASLTMLLGESADNLLSQAAHSYLLANHPYGMFLMTLATRRDDALSSILNSPIEYWLGLLDRSLIGKDGTEDEKFDVLEQPQLFSTNQQAYLCFAMISMPEIARERRDFLRRMMGLMKSHSNLPHGPQGQPLQTQIDILEPALNLILGEQQPGDVSRSMQAITRLCFHYGESIEAARRNDYLWANIRSPVEYLDLELVAAAVCMGRASGNIQFQELTIHDAHAEIPLLIAEERLRPSGRQR